MAGLPMKYDGWGYEDKTVTITAHTNLFEFTKQGRTQGYIIRYTSDFYYFIVDDDCIPFLCELDDNANYCRITLVVNGNLPNNRNITVRRYYSV